MHMQLRLDLGMFDRFLMVACRLGDVFEYPYGTETFPATPEDELL